ncbi:MAG: ThuA domain-containing protein [Rhodothermales bacterium]
MRVSYAFLVAVLIASLAACSGSAEIQGPAETTAVALCGGSPCESAPPRFDVLLYTNANGHVHSSIPAGVAMIEALGKAHGFTVTTTDDSTMFTAGNLVEYEAVVFLSTTGDMLGDAEQAAFEQYIQSGGGYAGIHAAAAAEYDWEWYGQLVGAHFQDHPEQQDATVLVLDQHHPSTAHLPNRWERYDEWYNYRWNPRGNVHVLMVLDTQSYDGSTMGTDHPIAWTHEYDGGRAWYTGLGHTDESYADPLFEQHVLRGIEWAAGAIEADAGATRSDHFELVELTNNVVDPIEMAISNDGRVFYNERYGAVKVWEPETGEARQIGYIPVNMTIEDGMLGLTLDPNFDTNPWIYLYYAPANMEDQRLSRFTYRDGMLDMSSEKVILEVPVQREGCCHAGGSLAFGPDGSLFLSTGDNTVMFKPYAGSPMDNRPGHIHNDARRSSSNTVDLRGKVLRILPQADGTYTIPDDNLFPDGQDGRPEIYAMGMRNPYRISVDQQTGWLYWGDVGYGTPPDPNRGPWGWEEFNQAKEAGFFGWPLFAGPNEPYRAYDYITETSGPYFDPEAPINDSPYNTGARELPPAQPSLIWYTYGMSEEFPELGAGGMSAMGGPVYRYNAEMVGEHGFPAYYDGTFIIYEWMRNWIMGAHLDDNGELVKIAPFLEEMTFSRPMDIEFGPDGRLYIAEWGDAFWGSNGNARIVRIDYHGTDQRAPEAEIVVNTATGGTPLRVTFEAFSETPGNTYAWDLDGDGTTDKTGNPVAQRYTAEGVYDVALTVTGENGASRIVTQRIVAGNSPAETGFLWPPEGAIFDYNASIPYHAVVNDLDNFLNEDQVLVRLTEGFDKHERAIKGTRTRRGEFAMPGPFTHVPDLPLVDRYAALEVRYTDVNKTGGVTVTPSTKIKLQPRRKQAEHVSGMDRAARHVYGVHPAHPDYATTALPVMQVKPNGYLVYEPLNFVGVEGLTMRVKPVKAATGTITLRLGAPDGPVLAEQAFGPGLGEPVPSLLELPEKLKNVEALYDKDAVPSDENYAGWQDLTFTFADPGGTQTLYVVVTAEGRGNVVEIDWLEFIGGGVQARP